MFSRNLRNYNTKAQVLKIKNGKDKVEKDTECDKNENLPQSINRNPLVNFHPSRIFL